MPESKFHKIKTLFITFFQIGAFTFGGGFAMIPLMQKEISDKHGWISDEDILDIVAIAESTPGPVAINMATFVGYKIAGFWGAFFSTFGVVFPSFAIIFAIASLLRNFSHIKVVKYAFYGIRAGVLALIVKAFYTMYKKCPKNVVAYGIACLAFIVVAVFGVDVLYAIIGAAVIGLVTSLSAKGGDNQ